MGRRSRSQIWTMYPLNILLGDPGTCVGESKADYSWHIVGHGHTESRTQCAVGFRTGVSGTHPYR